MPLRTLAELPFGHGDNVKSMNGIGHHLSATAVEPQEKPGQLEGRGQSQSELGAAPFLQFLTCFWVDHFNLELDF